MSKLNNYKLNENFFWTLQIYVSDYVGIKKLEKIIWSFKYLKTLIGCLQTLRVLSNQKHKEANNLTILNFVNLL